MNDLTSIDPRFLYETLSLEKIKVKNNFKGKDSSVFQSLLDKEVEKKQLREVSRQMEALFINMMFKEMRKNINKYRLIQENPAENIFSDMLYHEYSGQMAKTGKFGLADMIYEQYSKYI
ncbi:MAG: rod-binding protein [Spirochaetes bacterium]|nr:rod-binding protein [Spirochaetota bacterium]